MAHPALFFALALAAFLSTPLASAQEDHDSYLHRRETMDSLLQSLLEGKMQARDHHALPALSKHSMKARPELNAAPLAHPSPPKAQILPSLHLMKVTGAQASLASAQESDSAPSREALGKKYDYVRELRRQFEEIKNK